MSKESVGLSLDDAHNHAAGTNAELYVIEACEAVVLDSTGYTVPIPPKFGTLCPNAIHLIHGNDEYFRVAWNGASPARLAPESLRNIKGNSVFSGFRSEETYVLGIGHDNFPASAMQFSVMGRGDKGKSARTIKRSIVWEPADSRRDEYNFRSYCPPPSLTVSR